MKHIAILIMILLFSQMAQSQKNNDSFELLWKQVEKLEKDALTKSALQVVSSISEKAKREKNSAQVVKALLYSSKYAMTLEEGAKLNIVNDFKSEIEQAEFPTKNVLENYLANLYWQFFQQNRYQFYNRTKTEAKIDSVDFRTWDLTTIFKEITAHFEASLENERKLKKTPVSDFDLIVKQQKGSEEYRPTLFDMLAQNALAFYSTSENNITRPADKFEIDNPDLLCQGSAFVKLNISTTDKTSLQAKALCTYQKLLLLHLPSTKPYTYAEVDIQRLHFIHRNATFENKDQQFLEVLQNAAAAAKGSLASGLYSYEIAALLLQQGTTYKPKVNEEHRWKIKEALELCKKVITAHSKSRAAEKCLGLKSRILSQNLQLKTERHIPVNKISRLLVNYKNFDSLELTLRYITQGELSTLEGLYPQEKKVTFIKKLAIAKSWKATLKNENDFQNHSTEITMPPLENGQYLILALPKDKTDKTFAYSPVQATDIALIETQNNTHQDYQVVDRTNGKPIVGAKLTFQYRLNYNSQKLSKTFISDKTGSVAIKRVNQGWRDIEITIHHLQDTARYTGYHMYNGYEEESPRTSYSCFLFTDRSIYRPGQPLYFKGIAMSRSKATSTLLTNTKVAVELSDVNGQIVNKGDYITNDYGSFSGEFILPNTGLTGQFSMRVSSTDYNLNGYTSFSVEEYKRPKFETSFLPIIESYKVNDSVTVNGKATAYAGSNITDAKVSYRVKRTVYYPRWYYWRNTHLNTSPQEIAHGETITDASGNYSLKFKALPDNSLDKKNLPTFTYEVTADVTDINGETHSTTTNVTVGYHSLTATMSLANPLNKDEKEHNLGIATNNLNGQFVPAKGVVKMYKLKAPEQVFRPRPWAAPDYLGFTKEKFKSQYPHDAFGTEDDPATWKKGALVWRSNFDTGTSKELRLGNIKKWASGKYIIELVAKDKFGQEVKDVLETTLFSPNDKKLADNQLFEIKTDKDSYAIDEKVVVTLLSNAENIHVTLSIEKNRKVIDTKIIHLNKNSESFTVPVTNTDLGGFAITYSYAVYNSFMTGTLNIQVPYPSTDLQIETLSFRDKLQPGADETWSFKIKGPKGDKVAAELLANMYDASLDTFKKHAWGFSPFVKPTYYSNLRVNAGPCFSTTSFRAYQDNASYSYSNPNFDSFNWFGLHFGNGGWYRNRMDRSMKRSSGPMPPPGAEMDMMAVEELADDAAGAPMEGDMALLSDVKTQSATADSLDSQSGQPSTTEVQIRKNLQETAFFFPQLQTDKDGTISFSFTTPEALTKWNVQLLAHTKKLESSYQTLQTVTQKELMVIPNAPRFLREGDEIVISSKIANLTEKTLSGFASLALLDAVSGEMVSKKMLVSPAAADGDRLGETPFKVDSMGNTQVSWTLTIPEGIQAIEYKIIAKAGDFSDGEQNFLPVLTNRMLVTETLPMWVRTNQTKTFTLDKLKTTSSTTLKHHKLTLEITSNPAWYAVQALPYLMEYPYECNEQTFSKYYANTLATHIANGNPRIQEVFKQWANSDALLSNLEKNQELKSLLIQETPWLRDAQSETEQKKRIALLFNLDKMKSEQAIALNKLKQNQKNSGAWPWFNGGPDSRFVTQHIITGLGHLKRLNVTLGAADAQNGSIIKKGLGYLDTEFVKEYNQMKKYTSNINDDHLSHSQIHYLYMRSFFKDIKMSKKVADITAYYKGQTRKYWKNKGLYAQGMLALIMHREEDTTTSEKILRALEENSISSEELGMYWKENTSSWYWYQAPIETQALLIEAFSEIHPKDIGTIDNLKIWLLKNKQTNQWKTTKATTEAVYALLLQGSDWLSVTDAVDVLVGGKKIEPSTLENVKVEAGTGYYKTSWSGAEVQPEMAKVQISKKGDGIAWGALYWQYFEDLDKITPAETPLKLKKKLFLKKNTATGEEISEIKATTDLNVGDLVGVRIELRVDRPMEFVHMKDMRAAGFEPINVISRYKWQDGLGYYEATKDASTNFFFDYLPKGVYIFEYDLRVNNGGDFSNGITTIQSMYAPEFSSHSEGVRVKVD